MHVHTIATLLAGQCSLDKNCPNRVMRKNDWNRYYISLTVTITNCLTDMISKMHVSLFTSDMFSRFLIFRYKNCCRICNLTDCVIFPIVTLWLSMDSHGGWCMHNTRHWTCPLVLIIFWNHMIPPRCFCYLNLYS